jgi:hypothetical protein
LEGGGSWRFGGVQSAIEKMGRGGEVDGRVGRVIGEERVEKDDRKVSWEVLGLKAEGMTRVVGD